MATWTPIPTPWSRPPENTIKALDKNPKLSDIIRVLHCTSGDYDSLTRPIEDLLDALDIDPDAKLGSKVNKQAINDIVQILKDDTLFRPMLTWAESQGEATSNVNKAIKCIIHNVHARRKRSFRKESKDHLPSASPKIPVISTPQHQNSPVIKTKVSPIDKDPEFVLIKADIDAEAYYRLVPSGPAANTAFDKLKAEWTTKAPTDHRSQECISFKVLDGGFPGAIVEDGGILKILATRAKKNHETLVLIAQYGERVRLEHPAPSILTIPLRASYLVLKIEVTGGIAPTDQSTGRRTMEDRGEAQAASTEIGTRFVDSG
ncbi:hypothetical protein AYO21_00602 [Fonsecaea monophora]|uniref:Uncharacterized protein n=1 Tax=Fonsecaea monophora TaxID=254056 RepID=A0A177FLP0_9EURO|nr:hypothetical protein AYO21_00602 [Fonsecaea monophora]KAH0840747.1 hypothetical protein FOPE_05928 [Fonsecaea pedrosoi]OAG45254.1 hypothetical protein AYO21_00602 [Fonsecaea monophora]